MIRVKSDSSESRSETRGSLQKFLGEQGISTGLHYPVPLHKQECFSSLGYRAGDFPVTEELAETGLSLPMFPELTDEDIGFVAGKIKEFFR